MASAHQRSPVASSPTSSARVALRVQDLLRRAGVRGFTQVTIANFSLPPHDLSMRPQVPRELTTVLDVLRLPEDNPDAARVLRNHLLDCEHAEHKILVQVRRCTPLLQAPACMQLAPGEQSRCLLRCMCKPPNVHMQGAASHNMRLQAEGGKGLRLGASAGLR